MATRPRRPRRGDFRHPAAGRRPVHVRGRGRADDEGPRGRPGGQRRGHGRHRRQRRRAPRDPRPATSATAESGAGWLTFFRGPGRPRPVRGRAGHLRRARRPGRRDRRDPARRLLAAVPHPLRGEPDVGHPEDVAGRGSRRCCTRSTTSPTPSAVHAQFDRVARRPGRQAPGGRRAPRGGPRRHPGVHRVPQGDLAPDLVQQPQRTAQPRDPPPHRRRRHLPRPRRRSSASSAPSWPNNTTNGPKAAATSASTSWPAPASP